MKQRGPVSLLVGSVVVTSIAVVLYVQEPRLSGSEQHRDTAAAGTVAPEHRVAAVDDQGRVVQIDDRTGEVGEVLGARVDVGDPSTVTADRTENGLSAYVAGGTTVALVHLDTGGALRVATGVHPALSPDESTLAYVRSVDGRAHLFEQDAITGKERDFGTASAPELADVRELTWSADGENLLLRSSSAARPVWQLRRQAQSLAEAEPVDVTVPSDGTVDALAPYLDGFVMAVRRPSGTDLVQVASDVPGGSTTTISIPGVVRSLDSNSTHDRVLVVLDDDTLLRWDGTGAPVRLTDHVVAAGW